MNESEFDRPSKKARYVEGHDLAPRPMPEGFEPRVNIGPDRVLVTLGHLANTADQLPPPTLEA